MVYVQIFPMLCLVVWLDVLDDGCMILCRLVQYQAQSQCCHNWSQSCCEDFVFVKSSQSSRLFVFCLRCLLSLPILVLWCCWSSMCFLLHPVLCVVLRQCWCQLLLKAWLVRVCLFSSSDVLCRAVRV